MPRLSGCNGTGIGVVGVVVVYLTVLLVPVVSGRTTCRARPGSKGSEGISDGVVIGSQIRSEMTFSASSRAQDSVWALQ